jgi:hypothetical protein
MSTGVIKTFRSWTCWRCGFVNDFVWSLCRRRRLAWDEGKQAMVEGYTCGCTRDHSEARRTEDEFRKQYPDALKDHS